MDARAAKQNSMLQEKPVLTSETDLLEPGYAHHYRTDGGSTE